MIRWLTVIVIEPDLFIWISTSDLVIKLHLNIGWLLLDYVLGGHHLTVATHASHKLLVKFLHKGALFGETSVVKFLKQRRTSLPLDLRQDVLLRLT